MAYNLKANTEKFMLGRRLHHINFQDGSHSEPNNPVFYSHSNKVGNHFINTSLFHAIQIMEELFQILKAHYLQNRLFVLASIISATIHPSSK